MNSGRRGACEARPGLPARRSRARGRPAACRTPRPRPRPAASRPPGTASGLRPARRGKPQNSSGRRCWSKYRLASNSPVRTRSACLGVAVARHARGDQRVVVRPDRAVVIRHRVVARLPARPPCGCPSRRRSRARCSAAAIACRVLGRGDAGPQRMAGVGGGTRHGCLCAVERDRVGAELLAPEVLARSARCSASRLLAQLRGERRVARARRQLGRAAAWPRRRRPAPRTARSAPRPACRRHGRPSRASPSSPAARGPSRAAPRVLDEAVAVAVAVAVDPVAAPRSTLRPDRRGRTRGRRCAAW